MTGSSAVAVDLIGTKTGVFSGKVRQFFDKFCFRSLGDSINYLNILEQVYFDLEFEVPPAPPVYSAPAVGTMGKELQVKGEIGICKLN